MSAKKTTAAVAPVLSQDAQDLATLLNGMGVDTCNMNEDQIKAIANAMANAGASVEKDVIKDTIKTAKEELAEKLWDVNATPQEKASKRLREATKETVGDLNKKLDNIRQAEMIKTGKAAGDKLNAGVKKVDEVVTKVPGVSQAKGFFRGLAGAFKNTNEE